jgi:DNA-binding response OmpR family regulator
MVRILLVEDDPAVRLLWEHVLLDADYEVDTADTVEAGCELLALHDYGLVVADGRLSDGTGMVVADAAREKGIPALIVTAYAFSLREAGFELAEYDLQLKPLRPSELLNAVARALKGTRN